MTTNTGERFSENLKNTAKVADKLTVIRSMTHGEAAHERGTHNMMTGVRPSPATVFPSIGSIVSHEFGPRKNLPPYVAIPSQSRIGGTGYLGSAYGPFSLGADPGSSSFRVRDLALPSGIDAKRFSKRRDMRSIVDIQLGRLGRRLAQRDVTCQLSDEAKDLVIETGWDAQYGARPMKRAIQKLLENELAKRILAGQIASGDHVHVGVKDGALCFERAVLN